MESIIKEFKRYRWFYTSSGKLVVGGKSAAQNDELLYKVAASRKELLVAHTAEPGSPFCVILSDTKSITNEDRRECAQFTACFSRAWKAGKKRVNVDFFYASQLYKQKSMSQGTWGVKSKIESFSVPLILSLTRQKGIIRAVPPESISQKDTLAVITPGKIDKQDLLPKLELELNESFSQEELLCALPAGGSRMVR